MLLSVGPLFLGTQPCLVPPAPHPQALDKMEKEWSTILFNVMPYKETDTYILKSPDEASQLLDDHIVMTQSMSFSPYKKPFEQRINSWETKLKLTQVGLPAHSSPTLPVPCPEVAPDDVRVGLDVVKCLAQVCPAPGSLTGPSVRGGGLEWGCPSLRLGCWSWQFRAWRGARVWSKAAFKEEHKSCPRPLSAAWAWDSWDLQAWGFSGWTPRGLRLLSVPSHSSLSLPLPLLSHLEAPWGEGTRALGITVL